MKLIAFLLLMGAVACAGETRLGKSFTLPDAVPVKRLMAAPDAYTGKVVQVKGRVTEVCQMMGCWVQLADGSSAVRIKVNDGELIFPKSAIGRQAIAEGTLTKLELTREQAVARARHEAEEQGRKFHPASVRAGATIYQIQGTGAVILD